MYELRKWRNQEFRDVMVNLVNLLKPDTYVEVGIQKGFTFNVIAPLVKRAVGVDVSILRSINRGANVELYESTSEIFAQELTILRLVQ